MTRLLRHLRSIVFAASLLLAAAMLAAWRWSYGHDIVLNGATKEVYRELRIAQGRCSYLATTGWTRTMPLHLTLSAIAGDSAATFGIDPLPVNADETVFLNPAKTRGVWPFGRDDGTAFIRYTGIHVNRPVTFHAHWPRPLMGSFLDYRHMVQGVVLPEPPPLWNSVVLGASNAPAVPSSTTAPTMGRLALRDSPRFDLSSGTELSKSLGNVNFELAPRAEPSPFTARSGVTVGGPIRLSHAAVLNFSPMYPYERYSIPQWLLATVVGGPPAGALMLKVRRWLRARRRRRKGLCVECGYDLRGSEGGICPECGSPRRLAA